MSLFFTLLTQLINLTSFTLRFEVDDGRRLLPELLPRKARFAKPSRVLRRLRELHDERPGWKIRILLNGGFTGMELDPQVILNCVRVVFHIDQDRVLRVYGARERCIDYLLRHRYFGCMRSYFWNARTLALIDSSDTEFATKSRNVEGHCQWLAPWVDTTSPKRYAPQEKSRRKETSPVNVVGKTNESSLSPSSPSSSSLSPSSSSSSSPSSCPSPNRTPQQERYAPQEKSRRKETSPVNVVGKTIESSLSPSSPSSSSLSSSSSSPSSCPSPNRTPQQEGSRNDPRPQLKKSNEEIIFKNNPSMNDMKDVKQQQRLRDDPPPLTPPVGSGGLVDWEDSFSSTNGANDSFVHGFLFVLAFIVVIILFL